MKTTRAILAALAAFAIPAANAGTGWNTNDGGSLQFLDPANWDDGDINGVFPAEWVPTAALNLRLTNDWTGTLTFLGSVAKDTTFYGRKDDDSGAQNRTITLDGDILVQPSASAGKLIFDATVGFDLGGETRTYLCYSPSTADKFRVSGAISNGDLVLGGNGAGMTLVGNAAVDGNVTVMPNTTLAINWATKAGTVRRSEIMMLKRATLSLNGYKAQDISEIGDLVVSGKDVPGVSIVTLSHNNNCLGTLYADTLEIEEGGTLEVMADDLAVGSEATAGTRMLFKSAPALAGDAGVAGTPGVAVIPGVLIGVGSKAPATGIQSGENYNGLFLATYDPEYGVRRLAATETTNEVSATEAVNLVVNAGAPLALEGDAQVNSLQLLATNYRNAVPEISGEGTLTVKSGMATMTVPKNGANLNVEVDFGTVRGRFFAIGALGEQAKILKPVHGTAGLVFSKGMATSFDTTVPASSSARGFLVSSAADYTGDTFVQCVVEVGSNDFIPHGTRSGDTIVNGCLSFGAIALNGLYGTGAVRGATLTVGEDGSDSHFAGSAYLTSSLNITNSTMILDGSVTQGAVNVAAGATIGGGGSIATTLTFADGANLAVKVEDGVATYLDVTGAISGGSVTVNADVTGGKWREPQCVLKSEAPINASFVAGTGISSLRLNENGTELWAMPKTKAPTVISLH